MLPLVCVFLVIGDTHMLPATESVLELVANDGFIDSPERWVVHVGDAVDRPRQLPAWSDLVADYPSLEDMVGARGNHDGGIFYNHFPHNSHSWCGSEPEEPEFVAFTIDSEQDPRRDSQLDWAIDNHPDVPWIVFMHRPIVHCSGSHAGSWTASLWRDALEPVLPEGSIVVAGHEHVFCIARMEGYTQVVASSGGGKAYYCIPDLPSNILCEELEGPSYVRLEPAVNLLTYLVQEEDRVSERSFPIFLEDEDEE